MKMFLGTFVSLIIIFSASIVHAQWSEQTSPTTNALYSVSIVDGSVAWIGGDLGVVLRTTNGGETWTNVGGGAIGTNPVYNIFGIDGSTAVCTASTSTTYIYRTTDGGATWTQVYSKAGGFMDALWMFDSNNGFAYGDPVSGNWELYKTTDGGATWTAAPALAQNGSEAGWNNSLFASGSRIWFGTNHSRIYYSTDMGDSWTPQTITQTNSYSVWFNDASTGLMGGESALNKTTDGGTSWTLLSTLPGSGIIGGITGVNNLWWAVRQTADIYYSSDNGANWMAQYTGPVSGVYYAMSKSRTDSLILAVRSDGGISAYHISSATAVQEEFPPVLKFDLGQNYPNPFNPSTRIDFDVPETGQVKLTVYNVIGQEAAELINNTITAGQHEVTFNAFSLPSGAYFYKLQQGNSVMVKKMLLMK